MYRLSPEATLVINTANIDLKGKDIYCHYIATGQILDKNGGTGEGKRVLLFKISNAHKPLSFPIIFYFFCFKGRFNIG